MDVPQSWMIFAVAAMPREVKLKTLEGGVLTVEVMPTTTIKELKAILYEKKHCEDLIERLILRVKVLADGLLVDDDQTLESAGMLHDESEVTVIYSRNEVEVSTRNAIYAEGYLQVGTCAFAGCESLVSITIPDSLRAIGRSAFQNCASLTSITIPESVTDIGMCAFEGCRSLASISIPESATAIGDGAFYGCISLASITIPESVTAIGDGAFRECRSLESITIPESLTAIGEGAFGDCSSLASIRIPESVKSIGGVAFKNCKSLESITIPESVPTIGFAAFSECRCLARITIPESVTTIGNHAKDSQPEKPWFPMVVTDSGTMSPSRPLGTMPFQVVNLWQASRSLIL